MCEALSFIITRGKNIWTSTTFGQKKKRKVSILPEVQSHGLRGYFWVEGLCALYNQLYSLREGSASLVQFQLLSLSVSSNREAYSHLLLIKCYTVWSLFGWMSRTFKNKLQRQKETTTKKCLK